MSDQEPLTNENGRPPALAVDAGSVSYRFPSYEAYQQWCEDMVTKIYYAQIAMKDEPIREVVSEIGLKLWLQEHVELCPPPNVEISHAEKKT